ncbi:hypothetical protein [Nannocystis punicea]|uniref:Lipoprotein n=1 Tax=Nannocystis punicea TaxID=2995304 RepID=A0ABY7HDC9_9BACT|nr:hypothetical protein [Nannocystis poenicansa]WAS97128.1 hypothetical protein O0S08_13350 [Nannocystis poenicansa]
MAGGRGAVLVGCGLLLVGCWKDNPAFMVTVTDGPVGESSGGAETGTSAAIDETESSGTTTGDATTTSGVEPSPSTSTPGSTSGVATSGFDPSSTSSTTGATTDDPLVSTSTTAEDIAPACGATGFGPAELLARQWIDLVIQKCEDIPGRNFRILNVPGELVTAVACSSNPASGCTGCDYGQTLLFGFTTPEPAGLLELTTCVYLSAHGAIEAAPLEPCAYRQMALWWNDTNKPAMGAPLAIFGHDTLATDSELKQINGQDLAVQSVPTESDCSCVDADDCCPDKAGEYNLRFAVEDEEPVELAPGQHAPVTLAGETYEAYNGQSHETGACAQEPRFDWWLLRQP